MAGLPAEVAAPAQPRNALLDALRNPENKKKLKNASSAKGRARKKEQERPKPADGGNIFDALKEALNRRKQSIRGIETAAAPRPREDSFDDEGSIAMPSASDDW